MHLVNLTEVHEGMVWKKGWGKIMWPAQSPALNPTEHLCNAFVAELPQNSTAKLQIYTLPEKWRLIKQ